MTQTRRRAAMVGHPSTMVRARATPAAAVGRRLIAPERAATALSAAAVAFPMAATGAQIAWERPRILFGNDLAVMELAVRHAAAGRQLLGPYSAAFWHHLGPAWFYVLAAPYLFTGERTWSIYLGVLLVHAAAAVATVLIARRRGGWALALITAVLLLLFMRSIGAPLLRYPWNPWATLMPTVLFMVLAAAGATGSPSSLLGSAAAGTFLVQTHVSTAPTVAVVMLAAVVLHAMWRIQEGAPPAGSRRLALALAGLLVLLWLPPLIDELTGNPGNITEIVRWIRLQSGSSHSLAEAFSALGRQLAIFPLGQYDAHLETEVAVLPAKRVLVVIGYVAVSLALALASRGHRRRFPRALGLLTLAALPVAAAAVRRVPGPVHAYQVEWMAGLPVPLAIGVAALALEELPRLARAAGTPAARRGAAAAVTVLALVAAGLSAGGAASLLSLPSASADTGPGVPEVWSVVSRALNGVPRAPLLVKIRSLDRWSVATGVVDQLARQGWDVRVSDDWLYMAGEQFRVREPIHLEILLTDDADRDAVEALPDTTRAGAVTSSTPNAPPGTTWVFVRRSSAPIDPNQGPVTGLLTFPGGR